MGPTVLALTLSVLAAADGSTPRVAALPAVVDGLPFDVANRIEETTRPALGRAAGGAALTLEQTLEVVSAAETLGVSCDGADPACLARLGVMLAVPWIVTTRASAHGPDVALTLSAVDVELGVVARRVEGVVPRAQGALEPAVEALCVKLFDDPTSRLASIAIDTEAAARVFVDEIERGRAPLDAPITALVAGPHTIRVETDDGRRFTRTLTLAPGETLRVEAMPTAPVVAGDDVGLDLRVPLGVAVATSGAVLALAALVPFAVGGVYALQLRDETAKPSPDAATLEELQRVYGPLSTFQWVGHVAIGVGAIAFVGGAVVLALGLADDGSDVEAAPPGARE